MSVPARPVTSFCLSRGCRSARAVVGASAFLRLRTAFREKAKMRPPLVLAEPAGLSWQSKRLPNQKIPVPVYFSLYSGLFFSLPRCIFLPGRPGKAPNHTSPKKIRRKKRNFFFFFFSEPNKNPRWILYAGEKRTNGKARNSGNRPEPKTQNAEQDREQQNRILRE